MAKMTRKIIIQNPELIKALKGYSPVFGDYKDRVIVNNINLLTRKLNGVDNEILRGVKKDASPRAITAKMREITILERSLITEITNRKADF